MGGVVLITDPVDGVVGDIKFTNGKLSITEEKDSVLLQLSQRLKFFYTEWFLDKNLGIPFIQRVYVKNPEPESLDNIFKNVVLSVPEITRITQWIIEVETVTRIMRLTFKADTIFGEIAFSNELGIS